MEYLTRGFFDEIFFFWRPQTVRSSKTSRNVVVSYRRISTRRLKFETARNVPRFSLKLQRTASRLLKNCRKLSTVFSSSDVSFPETLRRFFVALKCFVLYNKRLQYNKHKLINTYHVKEQYNWSVRRILWLFSTECSWVLFLKLLLYVGANI